MNKFEGVLRVRDKLKSGQCSIGSWMQLPNSSVAEIMGQSGYDWVAVDLEHGSIDIQVLPDLFRALELGGTLPLARVAQGHSKDCKQALDAGAAGVIIPMIESAAQLEAAVDDCRWPPTGTRGAGFSRANLFGKHFDDYARQDAQKPLIVAMIENRKAVMELDAILAVPGLDAVFVGPYDLSASLNLLGQFDSPEFKDVMDLIQKKATDAGIAYGMHVVAPSPQVLRDRVAEGHRFIAYSIDSVLLLSAAQSPAMTE